MAYDQGHADALHEIRVLKEKLEAARAALRPFAEFYPSLQEWRCGPHGWRMQDAWPDHQPVGQRTYPIDMEKDRVCRIYVTDFKRAAELVAATDNKEQ